MVRFQLSKIYPQTPVCLRKRAQFSLKAETEVSGLCDDDMQEQGVSKILTINMNDMVKELNIK